MDRPTEANRKQVTVTAADLPLHCPLPSMQLWNSHPRVFIDVTTTGSAMCPYCGTHYTLSGPPKAAH
jgi:uncharacterized Zn-finger protein